MKEILSLNGIWQMRRTDETSFYKGRVPGSVMADLLENGLIPDPFYRENEGLVKSCFDYDYEYERSFAAGPELLDQDRVELVFEGLDTLAEVFLNGHPVLKADNMHRTWRVEVKGLLQKGKNEILVVFHSPNRYVAERIAAADVNFPAGGCMEGNNYLRKAHCMFGWDWGPQLPDCGIWRDVYLEAASGAYLSDLYPVQKHEKERVIVTAHVGIAGLEYEKDTAGKLMLCAELLSPEGSTVCRRETKVERESMQCVSELSLVVEEPRLWWPNGLGEHPLYQLKVSLLSGKEVREERSLRIGLRTIELSQKTDEDGKGAEFAFVVNGCRFFACGANYIPEDNFMSRITPERTRKLIRDCAWANFNMLRVWGGGYYPADFFFDACDEYGIMVWEDLMFACNVYEFDKAFEETTRAEIIDNVKRIRHHACLALWCGNNEMEWGWKEWFPSLTPSVARQRDYTVMFEYVYPQIIREYDPATGYKASSPSSNGLILKENASTSDYDPNCDNIGDAHYYGVWLNRAPMKEYRKHLIRFCSEFAFQSLPSLKTLKPVTEEEDWDLFSPVMDARQKNSMGNGLILSYLSETYRYPKDFAALIYVSQLMQAYAMCYAVEHFRRHRPYCMGALYWQLNDIWPGISWSSVDYYGRYKALHYAIRQSYAPFTASILDEETHMAVFVENESREEHSYRVLYAVKDMSNHTLFTGEAAGRIQPFSVQRVFDRDFAYLAAGRERELYFTFELYESRDGAERFLFSDTAFFTAVKHLSLPVAEIVTECFAQQEGIGIRLASDGFAYKVMLECRSCDVIFSDNFFSLTGTPRTVLVKKDQLPEGMTPEDFAGELKVYSLRDTY